MQNNTKRKSDYHWVRVGLSFLSLILCNAIYCLCNLEASTLKEEVKEDAQHMKEAAKHAAQHVKEKAKETGQHMKDGAQHAKETAKNAGQHVKDKIVKEKCRRIVELGKADIIESEKRRPIQQSVTFSIKEIETLLGLKTYLSAYIELGIPPEVYRSNLNVVEDEPLVVVVDNESFLVPFIDSTTTNHLAYGIGRDKRIIEADYLLSKEVASKLIVGRNRNYKIHLVGNDCVFEIKGDFTCNNIENLKQVKY